jgi:peptidoglycan/LPS O-acetylase OafA/YrhL
MGAADIAVYSFFMLSGFLMAHLYTTRFAEPSLRWRTALGFWGLRLAKIYPMHLAVLLGYLLVHAFGLHFRVETLGHPLYPQAGDRFGMDKLVEHLLLVSAWHWQPLNHFNPVAWSISAEWFAYLCFPLAILVTPRLRSAAWSAVLAVGCAALGVAALSSLDLLSTDPGFRHNDYGVVGVVFFFTAGMLVDRLVSAPAAASLPWGRLSAIAVVVILALLPTRLCYWSIPVVLLLIVSLSRSQGVIAGFLGSRPMVWLGEVSFSMYIVHVFVLECLGIVWGASAPPQSAVETLGAMAGMVTMSVIAAAVCYYAIEKPVHGLLRRPLDRFLCPLPAKP